MDSLPLERDEERLLAAVEILAADVTAAADLSHTGDTQFKRRMYVRSAFALIEGCVNLMATTILQAADRKEILLSDRELEVLRQERIDSNEGNQPITRIKFVPIRDRIAPVFSLFARLYGADFRLDRSGVGWANFLASIEIRNRVTHPKDATSFHISNEEMTHIQESRMWFGENVEALLNVC